MALSNPAGKKRHLSLVPNTMSQSDQKAPFFVDKETITLTQNGIWLSDSTEIDHEQTVRLFAKSIRKDLDGYFLQIGHETKRIRVEDSAYFVVGLGGSLEAGLELLLNDESREPLDPLTLAYRPGRLACRIRGGTEEAKFLHKAYFEILQGLQEDERAYFLELNGKRVELARK